MLHWLWRVEHCVGSRALFLSYAAFDPDQQGRASEQVAEKNESDACITCPEPIASRNLAHPGLPELSIDLYWPCMLHWLWRVEHCVGSRALSLSYAAAFDPDQQGRASEQVAEKNESDTVYIYMYIHIIYFEDL